VLEKVKKNETQNEKKLPNGPVSDDIKMLGRTPVFVLGHHVDFDFLFHLPV
jgi:hypothetical protein